MNDFVVLDLTANANLFNNLSISQSSLVVNSLTLPNFSYYKREMNKEY